MKPGSGIRKVSVIVPLYNMGAYVAEAIESVLRQTFSDWDLWIIDDGSKDSGPDIAKKYAEKHPNRIHYLEHESHANRGVSATRNLGITRSRSSYVSFLDADDKWNETKLQKQVHVLDTFPEVGIVYTSAVPINSDGTPWVASIGEPPPVNMGRDREGRLRIGFGTPGQPVDLFEEMVQHDCMVNSSVTVRRTALDEAGLFENGLSHQFEDWLLYTCVTYRTRGFFVDEPLVLYRLHPTSYSSLRIQGNRLAEFEAAEAFLAELTKKLGHGDGRVRAIVSNNRCMLYGRVLSSAEEAITKKPKADVINLLGFACRRFPNLIFSRRTLRLIARLVGFR